MKCLFCKGSREGPSRNSQVIKLSRKTDTVSIGCKEECMITVGRVPFQRREGVDCCGFGSEVDK